MCSLPTPHCSKERKAMKDYSDTTLEDLESAVDSLALDLAKAQDSLRRIEILAGLLFVLACALAGKAFGMY